MFNLYLKLVLTSLLAAHYGVFAALWDPCSSEGATATPEASKWVGLHWTDCIVV